MRVLCWILLVLLFVFLVTALLILLGKRKADPGLLEMAKVYRMPFSSRVRYIYLPALHRRK